MDLRYPIGKFIPPVKCTPEEIKQWINTIEELPGKLKKAVEGLTDAQLNTPYREGGWTLRQVIHHLPDSHINCYIRIKLALTEDNPTIKPYMEERWAELNDARNGNIEMSLHLLEAIHRRMVVVMRDLSPQELERTFYHPENKTTTPLKNVIALYSWHSNHHLAHITSLKDRMKW